MSESRDLVKIPGSGHRWPPRARQKAAHVFMQTGNYNRTAELTGIPCQTIKDWAKTAEWSDMLEALTVEMDRETRAQLQTIVRSGYAEVIDRVEKGNLVRDRDGSFHRLPMGGKDLAVVSSIALDKLRLADGKPSRITASIDGLQAASEAFQALASQYRGKVVSDQ